MSSANLAQSIGRELPYLRRYARALTGSQTAGDNYAAATLEAILTDRSVLQTRMIPASACSAPSMPSGRVRASPSPRPIRSAKDAPRIICAA